MNMALLFNTPAWIVATGIFILIIILNWIGYQYRKKQRDKYLDELDSLGPMEGSLLGLMGLMLAFSFNMAATKFEARREIIIEEANTIGTAINMSYLYPDSVRDEFLKGFNDYVEARIEYQKAIIEPELIKASIDKSGMLSKKLLQIALLQNRDPQNSTNTRIMVPALNQMIDIVTTREASRVAKTHPLILSMLLLLVFSSAFLLGYGNKAKKFNYIMVLSFALLTSLTLYLILELDRPRRGVINLDNAENNIVVLRKEFK